MCLRPITTKIYSPDTGTTRIITHACGTCVECVSRLQREWSVRLCKESLNWRTCAFFTLKYCQERVPHCDVMLNKSEYDYVSSRYSRLPVQYKPCYSSSAYDYCRASSAIKVDDDTYLMDSLVPSVDDIQRFWKRVRKELSAHGYKCKYFVCSEYGPQTLRPHYHGMIFTDAPYMYIHGLLFRKWSMVASVSDNIDVVKQCFDMSKVRSNEACAKYVSKYCVKPMDFEHPLVVLKKIPKPFRLMSKGLGIQFADSLKSQYNALLKEYGIREQVIDKDRHITLCPSFLKTFNLPESFYEKIDKIFTYPVKTPSGYVSCSFPRYWRDRCLPQKFTLCTRYDDNGELVQRYALRKDCDNPLCVGYSNYNAGKMQADFERKFSELAFLNPDLSDTDICCLVADSDRRDLERREAEAFKRLSKFYQQSLF